MESEESYDDITSQLLKPISVFSEDSSILSFERFPSEDTQNFEILEEHREELVEQARNLLYAKQFALFKSQQLDRNLVVNLMVKGVTFRKFSDDVEKEAKEKYNEMLEQFYNVNQQMDKLDSQIEEVKGEIVEKNAEIQGKVEMLQNDLSKLFMKLKKQGQNNMYRVSFDKFMKTYQEMSSKRIEFLSAQNNFAELKVKVLAVDDLGDSFKIADYEHLMTEVQTISSRIDQKEEKLDKMRGRFNNEKKKLEAMNEKKKEILEMTGEKEGDLESVKESEKKIRGILSEFKEKKSHLEEEIAELKEKSGILSKKSLMRDFDKINEEIQTISEQNLKLEIANYKISEEVKELNKIINVKNKQKTSLKHLDNLISCEEKVFALNKRKAQIFPSFK